MREVLVVGGGPAGAATAILLRRQGYAVTLLERAHLPRPKPCGEALSPEATPLLANLGVLDALTACLHGMLHGFAVFPHGQAPFRGTYAARAAGNPTRAAGMSIPRLLLDAVLLNAARAAGARVLEGWTVRAVGQWDGQARQVEGRDAEGRPFSLRAPLLIAADGVHSTVARRLGLSRPSRRLRQVAIVTHMRGVGGLGSHGEMHVAAGAYCGVAPLGDDLANVAMVLPASVFQQRWDGNGGTQGLRLRSDGRVRDCGRVVSRAGVAPGGNTRGRDEIRADRTDPSDPSDISWAAPTGAMGDRGRGSGEQDRVAAFFWAELARYPHLAERVRQAEIVAGPWTTSGLACGVRRRVDDGLLLVGDAGGYYDPFTGEGIYRGLRGAVLASEVAGAALAGGDTRAERLRPYARRYAREFVPKRLVEIIVHEVTTRRPLFEHVAVRLRRRPALADALVGVTGDFLSPYEVLSPLYLARLFL